MGEARYTMSDDASDIVWYLRHRADFNFGDCNGNLEIVTSETNKEFLSEPISVAPFKTYPYCMWYRAFPSELHLQAFSGSPITPGDVRVYRNDRPTLGNTPTEFT